MTLNADAFINKVKTDPATHKLVTDHMNTDLFRALEKQGYDFTVEELDDLLGKDPQVKQLSDAEVTTLTQGGKSPSTGELLSLLRRATSKYLKTTPIGPGGRMGDAALDGVTGGVGIGPKVVAQGTPGSLRCAPFVAGDPGPAAMAKTRGKKAPWRASW